MVRDLSKQVADLKAEVRKLRAQLS